MWFSAEGEQRLKDSYTTDDTLVCNEKAIQHFDLFLAQSKVLQNFFPKLFGSKKKLPLFGCLCFYPTSDCFPLFPRS